MIIPESEAVTSINTSIGQALAIVVIRTWVWVLSGWSLCTRRITRGALTILMNGRSLVSKRKKKKWLLSYLKKVIVVRSWNGIWLQLFRECAVKTNHRPLYNKLLHHAGDKLHHARNKLHHTGNELHHTGNKLHHAGTHFDWLSLTIFGEQRPRWRHICDTRL